MTFILVLLINFLYSQDNSIEGLKTIRDTSRISNSVLSPHNFSIGSNFDFINGVDLTDLYFNISTFSPNLVKLGKLNFGLMTGVRKGFARTYDTFLNDIFITGKKSENNSYYQQNYSISRNSNLGLVNTTFYINPIITLTENNVPKTDNKFSCYLGLNFDLKKQELIWEYSYDTLGIESIEIDQSQFDQLKNTKVPSKENYDQFIYSTSISVPFIIENPNSAFIGNLNIGYSNIRRQNFWDWDRINIGLSFEVIEKEFGLNLRTEIQYFSANNPPYIAFSLAKYFDLKKLVKFIPE